MRVLIAEDDAVNRRLLEVSLREWGHEVVVARDGAEAWEALQADDAPPLVVLDWMMPGLDGAEICRRVRAAAVPRLTYLIMLTARGQQQDVVEGLEAGADDYVVKPFDPAELRTRVRAGARLLALQEQLVDRARALEAMRLRVAAQERFSAAVAGMSDGIITLDDQWRLTTANRAACLLLDLPEEGWCGRPLAEMLGPFAASVPVATLPTAAEAVTPFELARPDTHPPLLLDARLSRLRDPAGALQSAVLIVRDVTDKRLPHNVQANFMSAVPHKLRTPLALLSGYLDLLKHVGPERAPEQWARVLAVWEAELRHLLGLVQRLLDFEHLTAQELAADLLDTDLYAAAEAAVAQVRARYPGLVVETSLGVPPATAHVACRPDHLAFILAELVENAAKFADKTPARVTLRAAESDAGCVCLTVTDNGPGIPHEYLDRIFEDFVQVEDHVTGQVAGWGVGLRMVRQVVEAYGGTIAAHSRLGEGSSFSVTLPAAQRAADPGAPAPGTPPTPPAQSLCPPPA